MNQISKHRCRRRSRFQPVAAEIRFGAGSGGIGVIGGDAWDGSSVDGYDGIYCIEGSRVELLSFQPPGPDALPQDHAISLFAPGDGTDGRVEINAAKSVYITAGPPSMPPASDPEIMGAHIAVGDEQEIVFARGMVEDVDQKISMLPGVIEIDGGAGEVVIKSLSAIILQVADGTSMISITPEGITIMGPLVEIN